MARIISSSALAVIVVAALLLAGHGAHGVITSCGQASSALRPCLGYLLSGGSVPPGCCSGLRSLVAAARTTRDRRIACGCVKSALSGGIPGPVIGRASGLPGRCGVSAPFQISPSVDCSRVN